MSRSNPDQAMLFPITPRDLAKEVGISWSNVLALHENGLLSFDPEKTDFICIASQDLELRFLGYLLTTIQNIEGVKRLVRKLNYPFAYSTSDIYFDWFAKEWKDFPNEPEPDEENDFDYEFETNIEQLSRDGHIEQLKEMKASIEQAIQSST